MAMVLSFKHPFSKNIKQAGATYQKYSSKAGLTLNLFTYLPFIQYDQTQSNSRGAHAAHGIVDFSTDK